MTMDEVVQLMKVITRYDNRPPSAEVAEAWYASANIAGWTLAEATEAVARHFTYSTEYLKPAHVTALIEAKRNPPRQPANAVDVATAFPALDVPPASDRVRDEAMAAARAVFARHPRLARAGQMPSGPSGLSPKAARLQRSAAAAEEAIAALDQLANRKPDSTPEGA
jgi:hypothetical protein